MECYQLQFLIEELEERLQIKLNESQIERIFCLAQNNLDNELGVILNAKSIFKLDNMLNYAVLSSSNDEDYDISILCAMNNALQDNAILRLFYNGLDNEFIDINPEVREELINGLSLVKNDKALDVMRFLCEDDMIKNERFIEFKKFMIETIYSSDERMMFLLSEQLTSILYSKNQSLMDDVSDNIQFIR